MTRTTQALMTVAIAGAAFAAGRAGVGVAPAAMGAPPRVDNAAPKKPTMSSAQQKMMAMAEPGEAHKALELLPGDWEGEVKLWFAPGKPPMTMKETKKRESLFEKRFVMERMDAASAMGEFHALQIFGYNNSEKRYEAFYIDNGGTAMSMLTGTFDADTKTFTFSGNETDMTGKKVKTRATLDCSKKDKQILTGYKPGRDGKEFKAFEGTFTRVK